METMTKSEALAMAKALSNEANPGQAADMRKVLEKLRFEMAHKTLPFEDGVLEILQPYFSAA